MKQRMKEIQIALDKVSLCGCGTNTQWDIILMLLEKSRRRESFYDPEGSDLHWLEFGAKVLNKFDLIEHGTSIGFAWLTSDGKLLLQWLRTFGTDAGNEDNPIWPEEWTHAPGCNCGCSDVVVELKELD